MSSNMHAPLGDLFKILLYIYKIFPKPGPIWLEIALKPLNRHLIWLPVMIR